MTDYTLNLVDAIISGRATDIETAFQEAITDKISIAMDTRRTEIAQSMFTKESVELDESTNAKSWAEHNARTAIRKKASPDDLHAEFKKHANNPGHPHYKGKFSDDKDGGKTAEQKAITNIAIGTGKADKTNYLSKISHLVTPKSTNEELTLEDYSIEEIEDFMMSEDFEQLDEVSKKTLGSYVTKAHDQLMKHTAASNFKSGRGDADAFAYSRDEKTMRKEKNRKAGVATAIGKLTKEEVEELEELSKATLGSYVKKAGSDRSGAGFRAGMAAGQGKDSPYNYDANIKIASKREKGINKAVDKLTKEEFALEDYSLEELEDFMVSEDFEQLDELSKATLGSYIRKASSDRAHSTRSAGVEMSGGGPKRRENMNKHEFHAEKRAVGISKAVDKLTK